MMRIIESGAKYSQISAIGEQVRRLEQESGEPYLYLNQGVNAVVPLNLEKVIPLIDFNHNSIQVYAPMKGRPALKEAINNTYFRKETQVENILINNGGMSGLDLLFQTIDVEEVLLPAFFWGSYAHILNIRWQEFDYYESFDELEQKAEDYVGKAVLICDPNNPLGNKFEDKDLIALIRKLDSLGVIVIIDSPYRGVFYSNDAFYQEVGILEHVIILESFSKSIGLSGQRIGFMHSVNQALMHELGIRLMYASNGVNAFAQVLVEKLLVTSEGQKAVTDFKQKTTEDIQRNIDYLRANGFLSEDFYKNSVSQGIFVVVNRSAEELLKHRIAAVSLSFFTRKHKETAAQHSRICVSVPHDKLKTYFDKIT